MDRFKGVSPTIKILMTAIILILLPGAVLSYLGFVSVSERTEGLKTSYQGTLSLVRDRIEEEGLRLEDALLLSLGELRPGLPDAESSRQWLKLIESNHRWLKRPFLLRDDGALLSSTLALGWTVHSVKSRRRAFASQDQFEKAEAAEFVRGDWAEARMLYEEAFTKAQSVEEKVLLVTRIGRCFFKMGNYPRGIQEYQKLLALPDKTVALGGIPASAVALLQIADGYAALGNEEKRFAVLLELYERVVNHPWDISAGISFYLKQTSRQLAESAGPGRGQGAAEKSHQLEELKKREKELLEDIHFLEWIHDTLVPRIQPSLIGNPISPAQRHLSTKLDNIPVQFGFCRLASAPRVSTAAILGYQLDQAYIVAGLLPEMLSRVNLGKDVGVGIVDEAGRVRFPEANLQIAKHLAGESFSQILPGWKVVLFHREGKSIEELVRKDKRIFLAFLFGTVFLMAVGVFLTVRAAAHELEVSRMKAEFVSSVSHELKTPLSIIRMFGETLESGIVQDEAKRQEFSGIIRKESERLTHLINNVLDFSKIDDGRKQYNLRDADVVSIVQNALDASQLRNRDLGFTMEVSLPAGPLLTRVDPEALTQALLNLLDNASKYSNEKKYIGVKVSKNESSVSIVVEDRGVGIPKEELGKIFDKFYRGQARKSRDVPGSGLGLTLVKHIAEAHRGRIKVESTEGLGSKFTLELPLAG